MPQDTAGWIALLFTLALGYVIGRAAGRRAQLRDSLSGTAGTMPVPPVRPSPELLVQIQAALAAGERIEAIKLMREGTGMDLKASKEAVERIAGEL